MRLFFLSSSSFCFISSGTACNISGQLAMINSNSLAQPVFQPIVTDHYGLKAEGK